MMNVRARRHLTANQMGYHMFDRRAERRCCRIARTMGLAGLRHPRVRAAIGGLYARNDVRGLDCARYAFDLPLFRGHV